jgi:hypothetical protein
LLFEASQAFGEGGFAIGVFFVRFLNRLVQNAFPSYPFDQVSKEWPRPHERRVLLVFAANALFVRRERYFSNFLTARRSFIEWRQTAKRVRRR